MRNIKEVKTILELKEYLAEQAKTHEPLKEDDPFTTPAGIDAQMSTAPTSIFFLYYREAPDTDFGVEGRITRARIITSLPNGDAQIQIEE